MPRSVPGFAISKPAQGYQGLHAEKYERLTEKDSKNGWHTRVWFVAILQDAREWDHSWFLFMCQSRSPCEAYFFLQMSQVNVGRSAMSTSSVSCTSFESKSLGLFTSQGRITNHGFLLLMMEMLPISTNGAQNQALNGERYSVYPFSTVRLAELTPGQ